MDLKLKDVAETLQVSKKTIYRWIKDGKIPYYRINHQYRFRTDEINQWAHSNQYDLVSPAISSEEPVSVSSFLRKGGIYYNVAGENTTDILKGCVETIATPSSVDKENLFVCLLKREEMASTGIGNGIAVPHPRDPIVTSVADESLYLCFPHKEVDFNSIDEQPVHSLFLIISADQTRHLRLLSQLSHLCRQQEFVNLLKEHSLREDIFRYLEGSD